MCFDCAQVWALRDHKVVHYVELLNTAHAHRQLGCSQPSPADRKGRGEVEPDRAVH